MLSKNFLLVFPVVVRIPAQFQPILNLDEVDAAFNMPLELALSSAAHRHQLIQWEGRPILLHFFDVYDTVQARVFVVWGMTSHALILAAHVAYLRPPEFGPLQPRNKIPVDVVRALFDKSISSKL